VVVVPVPSFEVRCWILHALVLFSISFLCPPCAVSFGSPRVTDPCVGGGLVALLTVGLLWWIFLRLCAIIPNPRVLSVGRSSPLERKLFRECTVSHEMFLRRSFCFLYPAVKVFTVACTFECAVRKVVNKYNEFRSAPNGQIPLTDRM